MMHGCAVDPGLAMLAWDQAEETSIVKCLLTPGLTRPPSSAAAVMYAVIQAGGDW